MHLLCVQAMKVKLIDASVFHNGEQIRIWQQQEQQHRSHVFPMTNNKGLTLIVK